MAHNNVAIFIPNVGCPNICSFCNQRSISGENETVSFERVLEICTQAFNQITDKSNTEIAFFGGSFTAVERSYMLGLLQTVQPFIGVGKFRGIRISTRPDGISDDILLVLKQYGVKVIELGVQSMSDEVLYANDRGHTSQDVINASHLITNQGFELVLQMMVGLYKSTAELDRFTADCLVKLKPSAVRIYPVVILKGSRLAQLYQLGEYTPFGLDTAVRLCADLLKLFNRHSIKVIRLGLHSSELVEQQLVGGLYHPAFRELCESLIFRDIITDSIGDLTGQFLIYVSNKSVSKAVGHGRSNIKYFSQIGVNIKVIGVEIEQKPYDSEWIVVKAN